MSTSPDEVLADVFVLPTTKPVDPTDALAESVLRIAERYMRQPHVFDTKQSLEQVLTSPGLSRLDRSMIVALIGLAYSDDDHVDRDLVEVHNRLLAATRHISTDEHIACCDDTCRCVIDGSQRCEQCEDRPRDLLDDAIRYVLAALAAFGARPHLLAIAKAAS